MAILIDCKSCTLCASPVPTHSIIDGESVFCCIGCHAVFGILHAQNQLNHYADHPIFIQALQSGLISNPALLAHIEQQKAEVEGGERQKLYIEIKEMWCPSCALVIRLMIAKERGVINSVVDYTTDLACVEFSPRYLSKDKIFKIIKELGYVPATLDSVEKKSVSLSLYLRFGVAAFCSLNIMMFAYPIYATYFDYDGEDYGFLFAFASFICSLPVIFYSAFPIWKRLLSAFKVGFLGMEVLVAIGVFSAFLLSVVELFSGGTRVYFDSMSIIIFFVLLGKIIEAKAKFSAKESLIRLTRENPRRGRKRFPDGRIEFVSIKEIFKGDILIAHAGEKISLDGIVISGQGASDESLMTGEVIPIPKRVSCKVLGGAILIQGSIEYEVSCSSTETALHQIIQMIEQDIGHKSSYVRAADQMISWFVPVILAIGALSGIFYWFFSDINDLNPNETAWLRALAVLLISCPCAIGIAAPAAESYLLNGLASLGAIVRNRGALTFIGNEDVIIFDKTGTVTEGSFKVLSGIDSMSEEDKNALHNLTLHSIHPVASAIAKATYAIRQDVVNLEEVIGHGLQGTINGHFYVLGSDRFMRLHGVDLKTVISRKVLPQLEAELGGITSSVYLAKDGKYLTKLTLGDRLREGISELLLSLKPAHVILVSGDAEKHVAAVASACGFTEWKSECTPMEKRDYVNSLKNLKKTVCMLGDGINDASALAAAHVGISVVSASDMSIQVSDLLMTTDRLLVFSQIRKLAIKGQKIIRQNLFWAFFYNIIGVGLAASGLLSPIFAAFAMSISSVTVLLNAHRLHQDK